MAATTGVPYETIRRIRVGITKHPRVDTFVTLCSFYGKRR